MVEKDWLFIHLETPRPFHASQFEKWQFCLVVSLLGFVFFAAFGLCKTLFEVCLKCFGDKSGFDLTRMSSHPLFNPEAQISPPKAHLKESQCHVTSNTRQVDLKRFCLR